MPPKYAKIAHRKYAIYTISKKAGVFMAMDTFNTFLERQNPELLERFAQHLSSVFPKMPPEQLEAINKDLVAFFLGRMLGTLTVDSALSQSIIAGTLEAKVSPETMRKNIGVFFSILNALCLEDSVLSKADQTHIIKMLEQSHKFLLINIFLVAPRNLKES